MTSVSARRGLAPGAVLFACLLAAQAAILVLSPILPQVAAEFDVSTSAAAQLRSVSGITAGVVAVILAARGGRVRLTSLLQLGLLLLGAGSLASALAPGFSFLLGAQVVIGIGLALVLSGAMAASEAWARRGESARVLSWALIGGPCAWIVGQPLVGAVAAENWRWAWIAVPLLSSLVALGAVAGRGGGTPEGALECDPAGLWRLPGVRSWALGELAAFSAWAGTLVFAGAFFIDAYGASVRLTGMVLGLVAAAYLPGNFLGRRWLRRGPASLLVGFPVLSALVVAVLGGIRQGVVFSTLVLAGLAFLAGGRTIAGAAFGLQLAEGRRLAAMSVRTAALQFGYLFGTVIGGIVLPGWGYAGVGWAFAVLFVVAGAVHAPRSLESGAFRVAAGHLRRG